MQVPTSQPGPSDALSALKGQYFISYAAMGAIFPYLAVYLNDCGLTDEQVGLTFAAGCVPFLFTPLLTSLLADTRVSPRILLCVLYVSGALSMAAMFFVSGFPKLLAIYVLYRTVYAGVLPLLDGIHFSAQQPRLRLGLSPEPYHRVRVWGSIGYVLPSLPLYFILWGGMRTSGTILVSAVLALLAAADVAYRVPSLAERTSVAVPTMPSTEAALAVLRPPLRVFCLAMFVLWLGVTAHGTFYPIYLKEQLGIEDRWIGLVSALSVIVEIGWIFAYGRLIRLLGLRRVMLLGLFTAVLRLLLLAAFPNRYVGVLTQLGHGPWVLALYVIPPAFLNRNAHDRFRHSIQGLYTMLISGFAVILGNLLGGWVKHHYGNAALFYYAAACAGIATALIWVAFHEEHREA
jgi:MFS transporter, PPP family, 3-phenylpropionic acid transporter